MSAEPVAWMTPGGDVSRSLEWCKERCWPEGEQPTPLYAQSPAQARALAIAEIADFCESLDPTLRPHAVAERIRARFGVEQDAPEIFSGTMDALNSLGVRK